METVMKYAKEAIVPAAVLAAALYFGWVKAGTSAPAFLQGKG